MRKNGVSFGRMAEKLFRYLVSQYQADQPFPYPLQKGHNGSLLGTVFAIYIAHMIRREEEFPGRERIVQRILALRNTESGLFKDPGIDSSHLMRPDRHSQLYISLQSSYFCLAALRSLEVKIDPRVFWLTPLLERGAIQKWLDNLDWSNPWLVSNLDMFVGIFLLEWQAYDKTDTAVAEAVEAYFMWHDDRQVTASGTWGNQDDPLNAMAGAYHIFLHYDFCGRPIQYVESIIDSTLNLVWRDGLFVFGGGGGSCEDMDAIDVLVRLSLISDYRSDDVFNVLKLAARMLSINQGPDGGFSWRLQPALSRLLVIRGTSISGSIYSYFYKLRNRSHYCSTNYYSSISSYPFKCHQSDMWSSWFRPLALALVARRYDSAFETVCDWRMPYWPGLGYDPFISAEERRLRSE